LPWAPYRQILTQEVGDSGFGRSGHRGHGQRRLCCGGQLLVAPEAVFGNPFGQGSFGPDILEQYAAALRDPVRVHGICEEYRAAATIDLEHDQVDKDAGNKIQCPMLHLWAEGGPLDTFYGNDGGSLGIWRQWAPRAGGQAMKGGHFFPEENPTDTVALIKQFLVAR
jgi:haloacetate dehalogenase